jgi:flagellar biosynthesis component FlhA
LVTGSILGEIGIALVVSTFVFLVGKVTGIPGFGFLFIGAALLVIYSVVQNKEMTARY